MTSHNHLPDPDYAQSLVAVDKMIEMARNTDTKPRKVESPIPDIEIDSDLYYSLPDISFWR